MPDHSFKIGSHLSSRMLHFAMNFIAPLPDVWIT